MAISFQKYQAQLVAAWKDVLDDKSSTNWSLFGYEGQTNELKVVSSGSGGVEELSDDLNSGKIMYAYVRIEDPTTGLKKFLLINWQGEGAPVLRKGTCANHIHDVAKLLSGAHLTINARNEDDIDLERLLKKLSAVSSGYSFKEPRGAHLEEKRTAVGTNYTRVVPAQELNPSVMQDFWKCEEEEEKRRIAAEKEQKRQQQLQLEQEQRMREEKEHQLREQQMSSAKKLQPAHVPIKTSPQPLSPEKTVANFSAPMTEAERMRQQRNQEARELIGSRVGAAKAIFTRNTSEGQLQTKLSTAPPAKPARNNIAQRINAFNKPPAATTAAAETTNGMNKQLNSQPAHKTASVAAVAAAFTATATATAAAVTAAQEQPVAAEITDNANIEPEQLPNNDDYNSMLDNDKQYSTIKRSPHSKSSSLQSPDDNSSSIATNTEVYRGNGASNGEEEDDSSELIEEEEVRTKVSITVQQPQSAKNGNSPLERNECLVNEDDFICHDALDDLGLKARALYDYQAADESEITFDPDDIITNIDQIDEGWWQGLGPDGTYGLFPANYVEIID